MRGLKHEVHKLAKRRSQIVKFSATADLLQISPRPNEHRLLFRRDRR